jgi:hypothetical protein
MSKTNYNYTIGNRTRDLPVCSAVPQPTTPQREAVVYNKVPERCIEGEETEKDGTKGKERKEIRIIEKDARIYQYCVK